MTSRTVTALCAAFALAACSAAPRTPPPPNAATADRDSHPERGDAKGAIPSGKNIPGAIEGGPME
jgi:hypothetical protein